MKPEQSGRPTILWANKYCLLDTSSGASMAVRQMLLQLAEAGYNVQILGASHFDNPVGTAGLLGRWDAISRRPRHLVTLPDGPLKHRTYVTASTDRGDMTTREETDWMRIFRDALNKLKPALVFYYGGRPADWLIPIEAGAMGIPSAFYVANANYHGDRWCRDVNLLLTDSQATAKLYRDRLGVDVAPVGAFIDPAKVIAKNHNPRSVLFINPTLRKGAAIVVRLAMLLEKRRPDILFEVVESRGVWSEVLRQVSSAAGDRRETLGNVEVTSNTADMRPVYGRARVILTPSLAAESGPRVLVEAMLNGIPAIGTDRGGIPEMMGAGGIVLKFHPDIYQPPYNRLPPDEVLDALARQIEQLYDDERSYGILCQRAREVASHSHGLEANTRRLIEALTPLLAPVSPGAG